MKSETKAWVDAAEIDFHLTMRATHAPAIPEGVCFHAQQCIEKYLKALLEEAERPIPRTHDLGTLLLLTTDLLPDLAQHTSNIRAVSPFAVTMRYPGGVSPWDDVRPAADLAYATMEAVRSLVRARLRARV